MIVSNKLDRKFGPVGAPAGIVMFIAGAIVCVHSLTGLVLVFLGAFVGFTSTSTLVDYDRKRIKLSNNLFGIIRIGEWVSVQPGMKLGIYASNLAWRAYSRSNRVVDIPQKDFRIVLYSSEKKQIMQVLKTCSLEKAREEILVLKKKLGIGEI